jgi:hypothetical protein
MIWTRKAAGHYTRDGWDIVKVVRSGWAVRFHGHTGLSVNKLSDAMDWVDRSDYAQQFAAKILRKEAPK